MSACLKVYRSTTQNQRSISDIRNIRQSYHTALTASNLYIKYPQYWSDNMSSVHLLIWVIDQETRLHARLGGNIRCGISEPNLEHLMPYSVPVSSAYANSSLTHIEAISDNTVQQRNKYPSIHTVLYEQIPPMTTAAITKLGKGAAKNTWGFFLLSFAANRVPHARSTGRERGPWAGLCGPSTKFPTDVGEEERETVECYGTCPVRLETFAWDGQMIALRFS